jgi:hypothetical protein
MKNNNDLKPNKSKVDVTDLEKTLHPITAFF